MNATHPNPVDPHSGAALMTVPDPAAAQVEAYLTRLRHATVDLPDGPRAELLDNIGAHLAETVPAGADEVTARRALDELGSPEEVAAAARAESGPATQTRPDDTGSLAYDVLTILALLLGGFVVPLLGWVAGVVMLWSGPRWTTGEKILGTLVWPVTVVVGLAALFLASGIGAAELLLVVGPVGLIVFALVFAYLLRAARSRDRA